MWLNILIFWLSASVAMGATVQLFGLHEILRTISITVWMVMGKVIGKIVKVAFIFLTFYFTLGGGHKDFQAEVTTAWEGICPDRPKVYHFVKTTKQFERALAEIDAWNNAYMEPFTHIIQGIEGNQIDSYGARAWQDGWHECLEIHNLNFTTNDSMPAFPTSGVDTDGDGMSDSYEMIFDGLNENVADADGDLDGDGWYNIEEYLNGADPEVYDNYQTYVLTENGSRFITGRTAPGYDYSAPYTDAVGIYSNWATMDTVEFWYMSDSVKKSYYDLPVTINGITYYDNSN